MDRTRNRKQSAPIFGEPASLGSRLLVYAFIAVPTVFVIGAIPFVWGWGLNWPIAFLAIGFYVATGLGVTVGFHRYFTHQAFKAKRWLKITLAVCGCASVQGKLIKWVADHKRHHAFSDEEGDPHSPWLFGTGPMAIVKGFWHAHWGWLFTKDVTNETRFAKHVLKDPDLVAIDRAYGLWVMLSLLLPALAGGLVTWSWWGVLAGFFWAGIVRIVAQHHVTFAINSICHMVGEQPNKTRDKSRVFWPLAIFSLGESWHNSHHADPTCARHGVGPGQIDISARVIWLFERAGWVYDVRWPLRLDQANSLDAK